MLLALFLLTFLGLNDTTPPDSGGSTPYSDISITTVFAPTPTPTPTPTPDPEPACPPQTCSIPTFVVPQTFFGITQLNFSNPLWSTSFNAGYVRLWDTTYVWPNINTGSGTFTYSTANDAIISTIVSAGARPDFVFGRTPSWAITGGVGSCTGSYATSGCAQAPSDINSGNAILSAMVTSLVSHLASTHAGTHWIFECVNEADLTGEWTGASGTSDRIADLVTFCTALRTLAHAADSSIIVLGPSGSSINASNVHLYSDGNAYATKAGAAASLDAINFHAYLQSCSTYCTTPELLETAWGQVNALILTGAPLAGKPVWITEANWGGTPPANNANLTAAQKRQYLARTYLYAFINNVTSLHWYAFDSHPDNLTIGFGSLCEGSPATSCSPNQAATTMNTLENWLVGSTFLQTACAQDTNATWACTLQTSPASTGPAMLIFNGTTTHSFTVPSIYTHTLAWDGSSTAITSHTITAGPDVVLAIP